MVSIEIQYGLIWNQTLKVWIRIRPYRFCHKGLRHESSKGLFQNLSKCECMSVFCVFYFRFRTQCFCSALPTFISCSTNAFNNFRAFFINHRFYCFFCRNKFEKWNWLLTFENQIMSKSKKLSDIFKWNRLHIFD